MPEALANVVGILLLILIAWVVLKETSIRNWVPWLARRRNEALLQSCDELLERNDIALEDREVLSRARNSLHISGTTESWVGEDSMSAARREIKELRSKYQD